MDSSKSVNSEADWESSDLAEFYAGEIEAWRYILGESLIYSIGTRDPKASPEDAEAHLSNVVRSLYPWIPEGSRVLDLGCGWGGPARMLIRDRGAYVHGVTVSQVQADFVNSILPEARTTCADMATFIPDEQYDVAIALESLTHVTSPVEVLRNIRSRVDRILIRDHVTIGEPSMVIDNWKMRVPSHEEFRGIVEEAGFKIEYDEPVDVPWKVVSAFWLRNLRDAFPVFVPEGQFKTLEMLCRSFEFSGDTTHDIRLIVAS
jgi:SAM-dependent methyltransferase